MMHGLENAASEMSPARVYKLEGKTVASLGNSLFIFRSLLSIDHI